MTFKTYFSHFEYQVILCRLTNASATLQDYINKILVKRFDIFIIPYLNQIFIYIESKRKKYIKII